MIIRGFSRGVKLSKAINNFKIKVKDKVCADIGC